MQLEVLTFTIAAGETKEFRKAGRYVEVLDGVAAVDLFFMDETGEQGSALGLLSGTYIAVPFTAFRIKSATQQTVQLLVTDGSGGTRRQPGTVQVVDTNKARTIAGQAFTMACTRAAVAGNVQSAGVWVPAGSAYRAVIEAFAVSSSGAGPYFQLGMINAALTNDAFIYSKLIGAAGPLSMVRTQGQAAVSPVVANYAFNNAGTYVQVQLKTPVVVRPGFGFIASNVTLGQDLTAVFDVIEEPNV